MSKNYTNANRCLSRPLKTEAISGTLVFIAVILILIYVSATYVRNITWQSDLSLFIDSTNKSPGKARNYYHLGGYYFRHGLLDLAIANYEKSMQLDNTYMPVHLGVGMAYVAKGLYDKGLAHYQIALSLKPDYGRTHFHIGLLFLEDGIRDVNRARREFDLALKSKDPYYDAQAFLEFISNQK